MSSLPAEGPQSRGKERVRSRDSEVDPVEGLALLLTVKLLHAFVVVQEDYTF
jgi:hypothetical protein